MVLVFLATGFEEVEALTAIDVLRRGEVGVRSVSITGEREVTGAHGITVVADELFEQSDIDAAKMLVLPGGMPGAKYLGEHKGVVGKIKEFASEGKFVCAICAAPMVLGATGIVEGKKATIYPGMESKLGGAEATYTKVACDGNIITGRAPGVAMEFAIELLRALRGDKVAAEVKEGLCCN